MAKALPDRPDWNRLFEIAAGQQGLFTTQQAAEAGYSPQLLVHYAQARRAVRVRRGIYRLVHFPAGEQEELPQVRPRSGAPHLPARGSVVAAKRWEG